VISVLKNGNVEYESNGNFGWARTLDNTNTENGNGIAVDGSGHVYVTGIYTGVGQLYNGSTSLHTLRNASGSAPFIIKLDASGAFQWARTLDTHSTAEISYGIAVDGSGNVYVTGYYNGEAQLYDESTSLHTFRGASGNAAFIIKLSDTPIFLPYTLQPMTSNDNGTQKVLCHGTNANSPTATVNIVNATNATLRTLTIGQRSNVSLVWVDDEWFVAS
jgi:hypothetical protein